MAASDVVVGIIFLAQTVVGVLGNSYLLLHYLVLYFTGCRVRYTDWILQHLIVANLLTLLCKGVPQTVAAFSLGFSLGDFGCKLLFSLHRVGRGVSIVSMCLLSVSWAITISSWDSRWAGLKVKAPRYIGFSMFLSCVLYMLINVIILMYTNGNKRNKTIINLKDYGYCSGVGHNITTDSLYAALLTFPDALCVGFMLWASSFMVLIL
ncbi:vomeronasal type-1 receptor 4-like [Callospermophilus lateralis]